MKRSLALAVALLAGFLALAQNDFGYHNPIVKGFNPDPSICRAGDDYYLVTSSFQYFPGVPLYHSKDLVNWEQIGHVLTRESQLPLKDAQSWGGIFAPTIRHHNGRFYMITTNISGKGNFIVSTDDPRGEWSDPMWVDMPGIDPSLFWDEDGKCWYCGAGNDGIILCQVNPDTGEQLSEPKMIWYGTGGRYPEAPHIYKKDGWYYLLIAEGGTEFGHGVTIARSKYVDGPYTPAPHNPILTHFKQKTQNSQIQGVGHADIIQAHDGSWWLVCLGFRIQGGQHHLMGRETFLAPVRWDTNAWPVVNGTGDFALEMNVPTLPQKPFEPRPARNEFNSPLGPEWSWIRNPQTSLYSVKDSALHITGTAADLNENSISPSFVGFRQQDVDFTAETHLTFNNVRTGDEAGMTVYMDSGSHYDICLKKKSGGKWAVKVNYAMGVLNHIIEAPVNGNKIYLRITGESDYYKFWYSVDGKDFKMLGINQTRYLSSETVGGFTGIMIGLWTHSPSGKATAAFDYFEYR